MSAAKENPCRKFQANIFNKSKCQNCFKPRESHLLNDEDLTQVSGRGGQSGARGTSGALRSLPGDSCVSAARGARPSAGNKARGRLRPSGSAPRHLSPVAPGGGGLGPGLAPDATPGRRQEGLAASPPPESQLPAASLVPGGLRRLRRRKPAHSAAPGRPACPGGVTGTAGLRSWALRPGGSTPASWAVVPPRGLSPAPISSRSPWSLCAGLGADLVAAAPSTGSPLSSGRGGPFLSLRSGWPGRDDGTGPAAVPSGQEKTPVTETPHPGRQSQSVRTSGPTPGGEWASKGHALLSTGLLARGSSSCDDEGPGPGLRRPSFLGLLSLASV